MFFLRRPSQTPPTEIMTAKQHTDLTLYYPQPLPENFKYQKGSLVSSHAYANYTLAYSKNVRLSVGIQPKPTGLAFEDFYNRILKNKADVFSRQGKAVIGQADGKTIGSLVANDVWVLVNTSSPIDGQAMTQIMNNLRPVE
jgi:hypothetical protein